MTEERPLQLQNNLESAEHDKRPSNLMVEYYRQLSLLDEQKKRKFIQEVMTVMGLKISFDDQNSDHHSRLPEEQAKQIDETQKKIPGGFSVIKLDNIAEITEIPDASVPVIALPDEETLRKILRIAGSTATYKSACIQIPTENINCSDITNQPPLIGVLFTIQGVDPLTLRHEAVHAIDENNEHRRNTDPDALLLNELYAILGEDLNNQDLGAALTNGGFERYLLGMANSSEKRKMPISRTFKRLIFNNLPPNSTDSDIARNIATFFNDALTKMSRTELCKIVGASVTFEDLCNRLRELNMGIKLPPQARDLIPTNPDYIYPEELKAGQNIDIKDSDGVIFKCKVEIADDGTGVMVKINDRTFIITSDIRIGNKTILKETHGDKVYHIPVDSISVRTQFTPIKKT